MTEWIDREAIAYAIIAALVLAAVGYRLATRKRRIAEKLRRRGIKTHGH